MLKVYISSTYKDLREHRQVAVRTLDRLGYETRAMEKYFATDERPLEVCLADVAECDLFIGVVGRRYGFIPTEGNPDSLSITECEFREAAKLGIPRLLFLSSAHSEALVPGDTDDRVKVERLRAEIGEYNPGYFDGPESLGLEVSVAVSRWATKPDFRRYLKGIVAEFAELPLLPDRTRNLSLVDIIGPRVAFAEEALHANDVVKPIVPHLDLLSAVDHQRAWLLLGEAGQGKSTSLRFLAFRFAQQWLTVRKHPPSIDDSHESSLVPVYVDLSPPA